MRFETLPRSNCIYEKYCFLSSVCLLSRNLETADKIKELGIQLINEESKNRGDINYDISLKSLNNFDFSKNNLKAQTSLGAPVEYVLVGKPNYSKLKSVINLTKKNEDLDLYIK